MWQKANKQAGRDTMAICFSNGDTKVDQKWDQLKKEYQSVYFVRINVDNAEGMLKVLALNQELPFYKFVKNGQDLNVVKFKTPESAQIAEVK